MKNCSAIEYEDFSSEDEDEFYEKLKRLVSFHRQVGKPSLTMQTMIAKRVNKVKPIKAVVEVIDTNWS